MSVSLSSQFSRLVLASAVAILSACGGGGGSGSSGTSTPAQTGTLTDSAVAGVQYTTSGGYSGTTDAQGHFKYNPGETVTFKLGSLTLGTVTATGTGATITPIELATASGTADADKVSNLLVLLQSLDSDGNADNGITISSAASNALTSTVAAALDLSQDPTSFASSGNSNLTGLISAVNAAGGTAELVTVEDAEEHFTEQFFTKLTGTWHIAPSASEEIVLRIKANGEYIMGEYGPGDDEAGGDGIERGSIAWDSSNGRITASNITLDTNGEWGLSHLEAEQLYFAFEGADTLVVTIKETGEPDEVIRFARVKPATNGIGGTWGVEDGNSFLASQFIFLSNGKYFMLDVNGDTQGDSNCGPAGIEYGSYSEANGILSFSNIGYDTNGCAGVHDTENGEYASIPLDTLNNAEGVFPLPPEEDEGGIYQTTLYRAGVAGPAE